MGRLEGCYHVVSSVGIWLSCIGGTYCWEIVIMKSDLLRCDCHVVIYSYMWYLLLGSCYHEVSSIEIWLSCIGGTVGRLLSCGQFC
jgi:hypothetical protein